MPYNRLPRCRACPEGQLLPKGSSVPDEGHIGVHRTDGVGSGLPTSQERGCGGGCPFRNSCTAVNRYNHVGARSPGAMEYSFSSWRGPDQWWHHGGGFDFHSNYVFRGAHDYARAGNCYRFTGDAGNCHSGGGGRTSGPTAWDI